VCVSLNGLASPGEPGDVGIDPHFAIPIVAVQDVILIYRSRNGVLNDHNSPLSVGRQLGTGLPVVQVRRDGVIAPRDRRNCHGRSLMCELLMNAVAPLSWSQVNDAPVHRRCRWHAKDMGNGRSDIDISHLRQSSLPDMRSGGIENRAHAQQLRVIAMRTVKVGERQDRLRGNWITLIAWTA
jgi:hypothetical protein